MSDDGKKYVQEVLLLYTSYCALNTAEKLLLRHKEVKVRGVCI